MDTAKKTREEIEDSDSMRYFLKTEERFQADYNKFKKRSKNIGMIMYSDEEKFDKNSKVVCDKCTKSFFDIYFQEYTEQETEMDNVDPIIGEILKQKIFMKFDEANQQFVCPLYPNEHRENLRDPLLDKSEKKLKIKGMDMYNEYNRYTQEKDGGDFIAPVNKYKDTF